MKLLDDEFPAPREPEPLQIYTIRSDDPAENEPLATLATGCLARDPSHEGLGVGPSNVVHLGEPGERWLAAE